MSSNLPPGVTDGMIPGNRPEDIEWEMFYEWLDSDCYNEGFTPKDARSVWELGKKEYAIAQRERMVSCFYARCGEAWSE